MKKTKFVAFLLVMLMVLQVVSATAFAAKNVVVTTKDAEEGCIVSLEGLSIGKGFFIEPTFVAYQDIMNKYNVEKEAITAAMATGYVFDSLGITVESTGDGWASDSFYMGTIDNIDDPSVPAEFPDFLMENETFVELIESETNSDANLGEFDYTSSAGWMVTVNNYMINKGAGAWLLVNEPDQPADYPVVNNIPVIRWQFSVYGYGADLGTDQVWGMEPLYAAGNRSALYQAIVKYKSNELYGTNDDFTTAIDAYVEACKVLNTEQADIDLLTNQIDIDAQQLIEAAQGGAEHQRVDITDTLNATLEHVYNLAETNGLSVGSTGGEWAVLGLARSEKYDLDNAIFTDYYTKVVEYVNEHATEAGKLHSRKLTDNSRVIIGLSSINKDATAIAGKNIVAPLNVLSDVSWQGLNGPVYALIALDSRNYETTDANLRNEFINYIVEKKCATGGWGLSGTKADVDITSMTIQALAPYYTTNEAVKTAVDEALVWLSANQNDEGGYTSWGSTSSESISQTICALVALGIDPQEDERFIKNNISLVDALMSFYDNGAFKHVATGSVDGMATEQALYTLVSYQRMLDGKTRLYDMTDVMTEEPVNPEYDENGFLKIESYINTPAIVTNKAGSTFNAQIGLTGWDSTKDYKLVDMIVTVPEGLRVTDVQATNNLTGGSVYYYVEEATGKLRVVYANLETYENVVVNATEFPADLFTVTFTMEEVLEAKTVDFAITGMSLKLGSDSQDPKMIHVINTMTDSSKATSELKKEVAVFAYELYTGDGIDIIPADKKAVAVLVTELEVATTITYTDGTVLRYNKQLSDKTGVATYVTMVAAETSMDEMNKVANYTMVAGTPASITFGDVNADGVINAQDALDTVNAWLRKTEVTTDDTMLAMNVNGDSRINTYDALGIVDNFVNGTEFIVVTYGARFSAN